MTPVGVNNLTSHYQGGMLEAGTLPVFDAGPNLDSLCRFRGLWYSPATYKLITCTYCYLFVFRKKLDVVNTSPNTYELIVTDSSTAYPVGTHLLADLDNQTAVDHVCGSLTPHEECTPWQSCCKSADLCCAHQQAEGPRPQTSYGSTICPRTWDGFACWSDSPAGHTLSIECPSHVPGVFYGNRAFKSCSSNGTWRHAPGNPNEWTDYTQCNNYEIYGEIHTASVACNIITMILLVPACFIFLYFKQLRQQHRIRLHICLMLSSFMTSVSMLAWDLVIFQDRLATAEKDHAVINKNGVGCRIMQLLTRYTQLAAFMWMFIEGFHLHRLLVHAFSVPKTLVPYYVFGFGMPIIPIIVYATIRGTDDELNKLCWVRNANHFEWFLYAPIAASLLINVFFLIRIVYIMVTQLEPHPNEPSTFRRAVKAVGVLMPLFGVQFLLFIYRPEEEKNHFVNIYEMTRKVFSSLQGAFIAIVFCYLNKEVRGYLVTSFSRLLGRSGFRRDFASRSVTMTTQYVSDVTRTRSTNGEADPSQMIPLKPVYSSPKMSDRPKGGNNENHLNGDAHFTLDQFDEDRPLNPNKNNT